MDHCGYDHLGEEGFVIVDANRLLVQLEVISLVAVIAFLVELDCDHMVTLTCVCNDNDPLSEYIQRRVTY
jgi:hypothetical protein